MYHKRPRPWTRKMPSRSPCPKAAEARGQRPGAGRRRALRLRSHLGGRCCLTAGATTDHTCSPDAWRLRHPDRWITTLRVPTSRYMYYSAGTGTAACTAVLHCTLDFATWSYTILPHGYIPWETREFLTVQFLFVFEIRPVKYCPCICGVCFRNIHVMWVREDGKNCGSRTSIATRPCFRGNLGSKTLDVGRPREKRWIR